MRKPAGSLNVLSASSTDSGSGVGTGKRIGGSSGPAFSLCLASAAGTNNTSAAAPQTSRITDWRRKRLGRECVIGLTQQIEDSGARRRREASREAEKNISHSSSRYLRAFASSRSLFPPVSFVQT